MIWTKPRTSRWLGISAQRLAEQQGCDGGFRVVMNCKEEGGQTVYHIHMHVLGQRKLDWPPG